MRHREPPPRGQLVQPTSGAESKLIQVLASRQHMRGGWEVATLGKLANEDSYISETSPSPEPSESDKLHPKQLTGALKFPNAETLRDREVRRDRLSSAPATRRSISLSLKKSKRVGRSKFPRKIFIRLAGTTVESPSERLNLGMT